MAEDSDLEKTEPASPKRLEKAREEGDVPRSKELATCSVLFATGLTLWMLGGNLSDSLKTNMTSGLSFGREAAFDPVFLLMKVSSSILSVLMAFTPLAIVIILVAVGSPIIIGGWVISGKALMPKFGRMNPLQGISNLFSKQSLVELLKSIAKTVLVGIVAWVVVSGDIGTILGLSSRPIESGISEVTHILIIGFLTIVSALVVIAAIDVPYQLYHYAEKLKMTKEEVRQESKESDGNPEIKGRIRQQQREMARRRMMAEIPKADVVITNPTHYAVAIKYKEDGMRAPVVVAKGADAVALKIREIANENNVTTLEAPKLARALFAHTELGSEIPQALYSAVAEVLAYVFQMRMYKKEGGYEPKMPSALPVPEELDPHSLLPVKPVEDAEVFV